MTLNLKHPLNGRIVGGPQLVVRTRFNVQDGVGNHTQIPDLRGVRLWQARNIAKTFATTVPNHSSESAAYVTDQSPAPGSGPIDRIPPIQVELSR